MKKIIVSAVIILAAVFSLQAQEVKEQDPAAHKARVFPIPVEHLYFHSNVLGVDKNFSVLLPRSYAKEPDRRYPVVYMLHGAGENDWEWAKQSSTGERRETIIVPHSPWLRPWLLHGIPNC